MTLITLLSLFSFSGDGLPYIKIPYLDKLVHFTFYFTATILGFVCLKQYVKPSNLVKKTVWSVALFSIFFGTIIEVLQSTITTTRSGEILDFMANSIGAICGALVVIFVFLKKMQLK